MRGRHDGNQVFGHINAEFEAFGVDVRKTFFKICPPFFADVEKHAIVPGPFHLGIDRARDDIARSETAARIVFFHELASALVDQHGAFAADGFGNEKTFGLGMEKARGMKLDELHVLYFRSRAPGKRDPITGGRIGIARVKIDLAAASGGKNGIMSFYRVNLPGRSVEHICSDTAVFAFNADPPGHYQIDDDLIFSEFDFRMTLDRTDHRRFAFLAGDVSSMKNAPRAVPAFAGEIPYALAGLVEFHSAIDQIVNTLRGVLADAMHDRTLTEPGARDHRITGVFIEGVCTVHDAAHAALSEVGVAV